MLNNNLELGSWGLKPRATLMIPLISTRKSWIIVPSDYDCEGKENAL